MEGFAGLLTPKDLLRKLERDYDRLTKARPDSQEAQFAAIDFFVTAEHMADWVSAVTHETKTSLRAYPDGAIVSHVANGGKHFRVDRHNAVRNTLVNGGAFQADAFDSNAFDIPRLMVEQMDGTTESVAAVATRVLVHWQKTVP